MIRIAFTANIQRHVVCPDETVEASDVAGAMASYFSRHPQARGYVLDDQGSLRHHMVIFIDGVPLRDRVGLGDSLCGDEEIHVFQALSGG